MRLKIGNRDPIHNTDFFCINHFKNLLPEVFVFQSHMDVLERISPAHGI
jgi:hypothetical protein